MTGSSGRGSPGRRRGEIVADLRSALADALDAAGPDAPTLCEGWTAHDLAAHLVARERRPDADAGLVVPALSGFTERVRRGYLRRPFPELVQAVRAGAPWYSPFGLPPVAAAANLAEYAIHREDVVRGSAPGTAGAPVDGLDDALAAQVRLMGRAQARRMPVGVAASTPDGGVLLKTRPKETAVVALVGPALELLLYLTGRTAAARVERHGDEAALAALDAGGWGL